MAGKILILVDVQNDFLKGGVLPFGYPEKDNVMDIVEYVRGACATQEFDRVFFTMDTHEPTLYSIDTDGTLHAVKGYATTLEGKTLPVEHCINGTEGWDIQHKVLDVSAPLDSTFVEKRTFGSMNLVKMVRNEHPEEIVMLGYDLSICVLANAVMLRAALPDTKITVLSHLCGDVDKESFDAAVKVLRNQQITVV